jgi:hypothetical protein
MSNSPMDAHRHGKDGARIIMTLNIKAENLSAGKDAVDLLREQYPTAIIEEMEKEFTKDFKSFVGDGFSVISVKIEVTK